VATLAAIMRQPRITGGTLVDNNFTVSVPTIPRFTYLLEYKNSLTDSAWTTAQALTGNGGTITFTDPNATSPTRFYRIRVQ
jgi:hypothetical protein